MQTATVKDTVSFRLQPGTKQRIETLAKATNRSRTFIIEEAINSYLKLNEWQVQSILEGLKEVEAGDTTPHAAILAKWEAKACK
jgi:predicted transcriptional regulator